MKKYCIFIVLFILLSTLLGCGTNNILTNEEKAINYIKNDLNDNSINILECFSNKDDNKVYIEFDSNQYPNDKCIVFFDENNNISTAKYEHIYAQISETDYEKIIEYGDYTLNIYDIVINGSKEWN